MNELDLVRSFRVDLARSEATTVWNVPGGFGVRNEDYPASYVHNMLWLSDPVPIEQVAGFGLRMVEYYVEPPRVPAPPGWAAETAAVMVYRGPPVTAPDLTLPWPDLRDAVVAEWRLSLPDVAEQLADRATATARACTLTHHARDVDGTPVAWCQLRRRAAHGTRVAQIEDVVTARPHRGHGYSAEVMRSALAAARDELVFLVADAEDWVAGWYARLGFEQIGRSWTFTRSGGPCAEPPAPPV